MDRGNESGGSVMVAEVLRQRAAQQRARWEAFQRKGEGRDVVGDPKP